MRKPKKNGNGIWIPFSHAIEKRLALRYTHYCLQFLLGVKVAPRKTENNAYAKFWGEKQRALWYIMVFSVVVNSQKMPLSVFNRPEWRMRIQNALRFSISCLTEHKRRKFIRVHYVTICRYLFRLLKNVLYVKLRLFVIAVVYDQTVDSLVTVLRSKLPLHN